MPGARDVYEEGALIFPCVRVQRDYEDIDDIIRMCRRRIRVPDQWYGDYLATLGAARIGERRLKELCGQYGRETLERVHRGVVRLLRAAHGAGDRAAAERRVAGQRLATTRSGPCPDGIPINVTVDDRSRGGHDRGRSARQPRLPSRRAEPVAGVRDEQRMTGVFNSIDPDIPHNAGSFRRINVILRESCIVGIPRFPHSCSVATTNIAERLVVTSRSALSRSSARLRPGRGRVRHRVLRGRLGHGLPQGRRRT